MDLSGTNNGVINGAGFGAGEVGEAFTFNGTTQYVRVPYSWSLAATNYSVEAWVKPQTQVSDPISQDCIIGQAYGWELVAQPGASGIKVVFLFATSMVNFYSVVSSNQIPIGRFSHLAGTWDGTTLLLYINGVSDAQKVPGAKPVDLGYDVYIGGFYKQSVFSGQYFKGIIDEASYYNRALSGSEIKAIYSAGSAGKCKPGPPWIATPPQSQTIECGSNATFSVTAAGLAPLSYQWYFGSNALANATNTLLILTSVGFAQGGSYSVVVTNAYGSATGGPAVLTVMDTAPPTILSCASNCTLSVGANCTAIVPNLTGQVVAWDASGPVSVTQNPSPGTLLGPGTTNLNFTVLDSSGNSSMCTSRLTAMDTTPPFVLACVLEITLYYDTNCQALLPDLTTTNYIVASDNCSSVSVSQAPPAGTAMPVGTNTVLLTVSDAATNQTTRSVEVIVSGAPRIFSQPVNLSAILTSNATLSVTACGAAPLMYQWQHAGTNVLNATSAVLNLSNVRTNNAGDYQAVVSNSVGSITSAVATLTVLRPPVIIRQPKSLAAAPGDSASFSILVQGLTPFGYQWQKNSSPLGGQTRATLALTNVQEQDFATYSVVVTNADGAVASSPAVLTLAVLPVISSPGLNSATSMLTVPTEVGPTYVLECKDSLDDPSWKVLTTILATGLPVPLTDNGLTNSARFYRVQVR